MSDIAHLRKMVDTALELGGWTRIDDCLPPMSGDYLVWDRTGRYFINEYVVGAGWTGGGTVPLTHWQLPSADNLDARLSLHADRLVTEVRQELTRLRWAEKRSLNIIARLKAALGGT
jgi:hypothetical protein